MNFRNNNSLLQRLRIRNWSLRIKITASIALLLAAVTMLTILIFVRNQRAFFIAEARNRATVLLNTVIAASQDRLYFLDRSYLLDLTRNIARSEGLDNIRMVDPQAFVLADARDDTLRFTDVPDPLGQQMLASTTPLYLEEADQITVGQAVRFGNQTFGAISISVSTVALQQRIREAELQAFWIGLLMVAAGSLLAWFVARSLTRPLDSLIKATTMMAHGDLAQRVHLDRGDEFALFAASFNTMADALQEREQQANELNAHLSGRASELEQLLRDLRDVTTTRDPSSPAVRNVSNNVIPIMPGVLVMPLIGETTPQRGDQWHHALMGAVGQHRARIVILDVTGVQKLDSTIAKTLLRLAKAAQSLGATALISGVQSELAATNPEVNLHLADIETFADLQSAVKATLGRSKSTSTRN